MYVLHASSEHGSVSPLALPPHTSTPSRVRSAQALDEKLFEASAEQRAAWLSAWALPGLSRFRAMEVSLSIQIGVVTPILGRRHFHLA